MTRLKPKTIRLKVIRPVYEQLILKENLPDYLTRKTPVSSSKVAYDLFRHLANETKEYFFTLHLNAKNTILCVDLVSTGSLSAAIVHPREVFKSALLSSCAAVVLLHNHPSGNPEPSAEDISLTSRLTVAAEILGIKVLDHIIIGDGRYVSLADRGLCL
jgi:DNA repair protein RadC